jgi:hypothetical protein
LAIHDALPPEGNYHIPTVFPFCDDDKPAY